MDKKIANNVIVGLMFAFGFVAFVFVLFNVGGGSFLQSHYTLHGTFSHVKGLHMGSEVSLSGLRVGVVRGLSVTDIDSGRIRVELSVSRSVQEFIRTDSVASVKTQGVLGDKYIEISIGSKDAPLLKDGDTIRTVEMDDLFTKGGKVVEGVSRQFEKGGDFDSLISNLNIVARNFVQLSNDLKSGASGKATAKSLAHLESILGKIDRGEGSLGALVNDPTVYEDLKAMTGGAKRSSILKYFMRQFMEGGSEVQREAESLGPPREAEPNRDEKSLSTRQ